MHKHTYIYIYVYKFFQANEIIQGETTHRLIIILNRKKKKKPIVSDMLSVHFFVVFIFIFPFFFPQGNVDFLNFFFLIIHLFIYF